MNQKLPTLPTTFCPKDKKLISLYNDWAQTPIQAQIAESFTRMGNHNECKKISEIQFKYFDFKKQIIFNDLLDELKIREFVNALLDASSITKQDRTFRFKTYYKRMIELIGKKHLIYVRHYLRKLHGFGIYQLQQVQVTRLGKDDKAYSSAAIMLIPTNKDCIKKIQQYYGIELKDELQRRNEFFLGDCIKRKINVVNEIEHQEEIKEELEKWKRGD
jgi:hypothetical protein